MIARVRRCVLPALLLCSMGAVPGHAVGPMPPSCLEEARANSSSHPPPDSNCLGVRPGATLYSPTDDTWCTLGFAFRGSDGFNYISTSATCAAYLDHSGEGVKSFTPWRGERVWRPGAGPKAEAYMPKRQVVGEFVYSQLRYRENGNPADLSLIRLRRGVPVTGKVCVIGGPNGIFTGITTLPARMVSYGQGNMRARDGGVFGGDVREDYAPAGFNDRYVVNGVAPNNAPNAGSPVLAGDGMALGLLGGQTLSIHSDDDSERDAGVPVFRFSDALRSAERLLKVRLTLLRN